MPVNPSESLLSMYAPLLPVDNTGIVAHQAPDFFALWEAMEHEVGMVCEIPYWASVWPGARLLARYILQNRHIVAGKTVLDFGSGGAVASIAAARSGAKRVIANDIDPMAHHIALKNSTANNETFVTDGSNLLIAHDDRIFDTVFVADMFYEKSTADDLLHFLRRIRAGGAEVLIADGNRPFAPKNGLEVLTSDRFTVNLPLEGCAQRMAALYRLIE